MLLAPGEVISINFTKYRQYVMKDKISGYICTVVTKDTNTKSAISALISQFYSFGMPYEVRTDRAATFRVKPFSREMKTMNIK